MARFEFTCLHPLLFPGVADFGLVASRDDQDVLRYHFGTDDEAVAEHLRAAGGFGVTEDTAGERPVLASPPQGGAGSSTQEWAAYAAEQGVEVEEGATREQIMAAVQAAADQATADAEAKAAADAEAAAQAGQQTESPNA